jgi:hypothetical protein
MPVDCGLSLVMQNSCHYCHRLEAALLTLSAYEEYILRLQHKPKPKPKPKPLPLPKPLIGICL